MCMMNIALVPISMNSSVNLLITVPVGCVYEPIVRIPIHGVPSLYNIHHSQANTMTYYHILMLAILTSVMLSCTPHSSLGCTGYMYDKLTKGNL